MVGVLEIIIGTSSSSASVEAELLLRLRNKDAGLQQKTTQQPTSVTASDSMQVTSSAPCSYAAEHSWVGIMLSCSAHLGSGRHSSGDTQVPRDAGCSCGAAFGTTSSAGLLGRSQPPAQPPSSAKVDEVDSQPGDSFSYNR